MKGIKAVKIMKLTVSVSQSQAVMKEKMMMMQQLHQTYHTSVLSRHLSFFTHNPPYSILSPLPSFRTTRHFHSPAVTADAKGPSGSVSNSHYEDLDNEAGYQLPPSEIKDIVDAPPRPSIKFSPDKDKILFLKKRSLPSLADLSRPDEVLAGIRIDVNCNSRRQKSFYSGIGIHRLMSDGTLGPEKEIHGLPAGAKINYVKWANNGQHLAFTVRVDEEQDDYCSCKLQVWIADVETGQARPLFHSSDIYVNSVLHNFVWVNDSTLLVCTIPLSRGEPPLEPLLPPGPKIQSNEQKNTIQTRTFRLFLEDEYEENLFDYYATSQLLLASLDETVIPFGPPAMYTSLIPSPDEKYILISFIHRPYSRTVSWKKFQKKVDLWKADGTFVRQLCDLPLAENIPITRNSVRKGMRSINWRADKPSTLYWVETQDGGNAKVKASPRDIVYTQPAEASEGEQPTILHKLDLRYGAIAWCDDSLALVRESWFKTRQTRTWIISPGNKEITPHILFDRSSEDAYSDPGSPMLRRTSTGTYVIAKVRKEKEDATYMLLNGIGATPDGNSPFLDLMDITTGNTERIWQSDDKYYERVVALMSEQNEGDIFINHLKVLISKESKTENTQYFLHRWPHKNASQITHFPHPYPQLVSLHKEMIKYQRKDGVQLTATLYLPPGYDASNDGPLPCLIWAYPKEFKSKNSAGQVRGSPNKFASIGFTSPLLWLARRFAVLSGPSIPIIGEGDEEPNDRYVEQLVSSAEAAVEEVIRLGVAHPDKIAIGGHSYGAFMTANLFAHAAHLFCCGIALSGAYNRTLTPFGFQAEERTLWEATNTYLEMSPFMSANKIHKPILLIHGEQDSNPGTKKIQSDLFFNALKGHGALCRLVVLPCENHRYLARESIMHVIWEMDRWLQKHCVLTTSEEGNDAGSTEKEGSIPQEILS